MNEYDVLFKIVCIGDSTVGKSSLLLRFCEDKFSALNATLGVDFKIVTRTLYTSKKVAKLQFWDTAGQERFYSVQKQFYRGAHAIVLVFDVTSRDSFINLERRWLPAIDWKFDNARNEWPQKPMLLLVGNKCDLKGQRVVRRSTAMQFAAENGISGYEETSALSGANVEQAIMNLCDKMFDNGVDRILLGGYLRLDSIDKWERRGGVPIDNNKEKKRCC